MVEGQLRRVMAPPSAAAPKAQFILSDCKAVEGPLPPPHRCATGRIINRTPPIQEPHSPARAVAAQSRPRSAPTTGQIGRASGRERVCQYVKVTVDAVVLKKQKKATHVYTI